MGAKKTGIFRQYWIWIRLLAKRLWRQPAYIGLLVLIPLLGGAAGMMEQDGQGGAAVAVYVEEGTWSGQIIEELRSLKTESVLRFELCDDELEVERSVIKSEADCGFVVTEDIEDKVMGGDWSKCVTVYETSASSITGMAKERISGVIFKLYSEQCYEDYMRSSAEEMDGISDKTPEAFVSFAQDAYERHLVDNSTFRFEYKNDDRYSQESTDTNVINDTSVFPIKGVFAVVIFISGMCGMLEYDRDRKEKRFLRVASNGLTYIVDIWIPTVFVSLAVLVCLWLSDGIRHSNGVEGIGRLSALLSVWSVGTWAVQAGHLLIYQCIVVVYCIILGIILRRQETIAAAIPILSLGSLVCAPVFIRLATYLPVFGVLEKLFPVTYYLML